MCRLCREMESDGSAPSGPATTAGSGSPEGNARLCARCGVPLAVDEPDDFLTRMLKKFGLLDEGGTVLERRERGA